ncbi:MAG: response regulator [Nitrospinaceae bacterium]
MTLEETIKILIADDHPIFRQGLKHAFSRFSDLHVVEEAEDGYQVLEKIKDGDFNVILLDISMPGPAGLELLKQVRKEKPDLPILVLSMYPEDRYAIRFLKSGASGYLTKESPPAQIMEAIRRVAKGGKFISPRLTEKIAYEFLDHEKAPHETLSDREFQVLCMIASGKTVTGIAKELTLSVNTISTHRSRILQKMKMKNNAQLTHYAIQTGLVEG